MSAEGRGQPLQRGMSQSIAREEAGRVAAQLPGMRPDPFRTIVPASAFRMEEHGSAGRLLPLCTLCALGSTCMHAHS